MIRAVLFSVVPLCASGCAVKGDSVSEVFAKIEAWLASHAPPLKKLLNPPADDATIADFEAKTKLKLPPAVRRLYLIHNGEAEASDGIFGCWKMLSLSDIEDEIELTGVSGIVPLFRSGGGDLYYVKSYEAPKPDLRLFEWWHEEPETVEVISASLEQFLIDFSKRLHDGHFVYQPEELAALISRDDL